MKTAYRSKLRNKAILICTLFAVILSVLIGGLGYFQYKINIEESYQNYAKTMVDLIYAKIDIPSLRHTIETGEEDQAFEELQEELNHIKENSDVQYVYMIYYPEGVAQGTVAYVMNGYTAQELLYERDTISYLGDLTSEEDFDRSFREQLRESLERRETEVNYFNNQTSVAHGFAESTEYVKTAYQPVWDEGREPVCVICADISMTRIYNNLRSYQMGIVLGAFLVVAVFLTLFLMVINRHVVRPIKQIAARSDDFIRQSESVTDPSQLHFQPIVTTTRDEIQVLAESLNHTMEALIRYMVNLKNMSTDQERISAELDVAKQIQLNLYPCVFPAFPERSEFDIYALMRMAAQAGGDFYNFFLTDGTHLCLMAGTVSGSGIPTTMFAAIITTLMKNFGQLGYGPARIMAETNNQISGNNQAELTAAVFLAVIDLTSGRMDYVTAGDMGALIKLPGRPFEALEAKKSIQLGLMEHVPYFLNSLNLVQGDMLFLYTPGVSEAGTTGAIFIRIPMWRSVLTRYPGRRWAWRASPRPWTGI